MPRRVARVLPSFGVAGRMRAPFGNGFVTTPKAQRRDFAYWEGGRASRRQQSWQANCENIGHYCSGRGRAPAHSVQTRTQTARLPAAGSLYGACASPLGVEHESRAHGHRQAGERDGPRCQCGHRRRLPDLDPVDAAVQRRRAELDHADAIQEVLAAVKGATPEEAEITALVVPLLEWAAGRTEAALEQVGISRQGFPDDVGLQALARSLEDVVAERLRVVAPVAEGDNTPGVEASEPEPALRLDLPVSWFAGLTDPLNEHPLFLRYFREARLRNPELPGVRVSSEEDLEPDGYRVFIAGSVVEEGEVSRADRYLSPASLSLLPMSVRTAATEAKGFSYVRVLAPQLAEAGTLAELLSMDADEVVVRRVADLAEAHKESLQAYTAASGQ
jgi:hypothetical protein